MVLVKKLGNAIVFFEEAIHQKNDCLSMYNLSHLYMYEDSIKDINKLFEMLIKSSDQFQHSLVLLSLLLIKQFGFDIQTLKNEIEKKLKGKMIYQKEYFKILLIYKLFDRNVFEKIYEAYRTKDFMYNASVKIIESKYLQEIKADEIIPKYPNAKNITKVFYEGFGDDIYP